MREGDADAYISSLALKIIKHYAGNGRRYKQKLMSFATVAERLINEVICMISNLQFHHVGLACRSIETEIKSHKLLGYSTEGKPFIDPIQRIHGIFMVNGSMRIELLEPTSDDSPIISMINRGYKMYHQGFKCIDLQQSATHLQEQGARLISPPAPAVAFDGKEIAFFMLPSLLIVELIQI